MSAKTIFLENIEGVLYEDTLEDMLKAFRLRVSKGSAGQILRQYFKKDKKGKQ